jgi:hypothetical protein
VPVVPRLTHRRGNPILPMLPTFIEGIIAVPAGAAARVVVIAAAGIRLLLPVVEQDVQSGTETVRPGSRSRRDQRVAVGGVLARARAHGQGPAVLLGRMLLSELTLRARPLAARPARLPSR